MSTEQKLKVVIAGDCAVGKTCLIERMLRDNFDEDTQSSISIAMNPVTTTVEGQSFTYSLWDTAGQEKYKTLAPIYFRDAFIGILVYDITSKATFEKVTEWYQQMNAHMNQGFSLILVGNKSDLDEQREITIKMGSDLSEKLHTKNFLEVSAKTGQNVASLKLLIDKVVYNTINHKNSPQSQTTNVDLTKKGEKSHSSCCK
ncbi:Ras-related protein RABA4b [Tritrichomonas foetus]|uniref:Ras-related protein RABA4b n=1 Tax=Tritrichomonas foetus TaxID=1144522 RepID=A0A1J4JRL9_9EUKA|nr:Ras-related protein RABA4b [Tritrichomonas foetus]|eukprot:OHT01675.1 Ras-related protein RABA4b [Tritrichomonas foetus]